MRADILHNHERKQSQTRVILVFWRDRVLHHRLAGLVLVGVNAPGSH